MATTPYPDASDRSIRGKTALITGAASGMGEAAAHLFAMEGAHVLLADIDHDKVTAIARSLADSGHGATPLHLDVSDSSAISRAFEDIRNSHGALDILISNAGISVECRLDDPEYETKWTRGISILLTAQQRLVRAALPLLRKSEAARIVMIASTEALGATAGHSAYAAAKAGVVGFTRSLAVELGPEQITVNCICPGPIETGMTAYISAADKERFARRRTALRRYGRPIEVAQMMLNLALPASSYVTGAIIPVDGGLTARNA